MKIIVKTILLLVGLLFNVDRMTAQDTIFYPDERYYWDYDSYNPDSLRYYQIEWQGSCASHDTIGFLELTEKELMRAAILKPIVFPHHTEKYVYGIAGTAIACNNPHGCYFYLCKKIDGEYIILDSTLWTHEVNYKYVNYSLAKPHYNQGFPYINLFNNELFYWDTIVEDFEILYIDTATISVPIFEAYFDYPLAMNDTFYIGMNSNGIYESSNVSEILHPELYPNGPDYESLKTNYSFFQHTFIGAGSYYNTHHWIHAPFDEERRIEYTTTFIDIGGFFPILKEPSCPTIVQIVADDLRENSVHINWLQTHLSTYCRIEYGEEGFVRGTGTTIDNITTTDVTLNNLMPNTGYDVYLQSYCAASDTVSGWRKISFVTLDTMCPALENLRMLYVRDVRAKIRWDSPSPEVSHCELEWGENGFEQGQGNYVRYVYDTSYSFLSLAAGTTYDVYVRTYCPRSNVYGDWQKLTFTTDGNSIDETENQLPISVNPNPTTGMVEVTLPQGYENQTVEVYDVQGKLLQSQHLQNGKATFNLSEYPNGVYVIKVGNASCRVVKSK